MLITLVEPGEDLIYDKAGDDRYREEQYGFDDDHPDVGLGPSGAQDKGKDDDADDIVDDGRTRYRCSDESVKLAEFLQGCDRDADGSG